MPGTTDTTVTIEKSPEEEFAAAFATEIAPTDTTATDAAAAELAAADAATAAEATEAEDEKTAADAAAAAEAGTEATPAAEPAEPAAEPEAEPTVDYKAEFEKLQAQIAANKNTPAVEPVAEPAAPEVQMPAAPTAASVLSEEELGFVTTYDDEWPDVAKAEALKRKVDIAVMEDRIYREVAVALKSIMGSVAPIIDNAQLSAEEKHYAAIEAAHPDYLDVVKKIDVWIEKQPAYLKTAMSAVLDSGSAVEVNDLFTRFKQETGSVTPQVNVDQNLLQNTVDDATIQALSPVKGGRKAAVSTAVDPNDYSGAWEKASQS